MKATMNIIWRKQGKNNEFDIRETDGIPFLTSEEDTHFQIQNPEHEIEVTLTIQNQDITGTYQAYS